MSSQVRVAGAVRADPLTAVEQETARLGLGFALIDHVRASGYERLWIRIDASEPTARHLIAALERRELEAELLAE